MFENTLLTICRIRAALEVLTMEIDKAQESIREFAGAFDPELLAAIDDTKES